MGGTTLKKIVIAMVCGGILGLPFVGTWLRHAPQDHCALDGAAIVPCYRVRIEDSAGRSYDFCCVHCAQMWLEGRSSPVRTIHVTDEATGAELDAEKAIFVRSLVVTTPTTGNRIHVFLERTDAEQHAEKCRGTILNGGERPFASGGPSKFDSPARPNFGLSE
jgi:hypothetical protein